MRKEEGSERLGRRLLLLSEEGAATRRRAEANLRQKLVINSSVSRGFCMQYGILVTTVAPASKAF